MSLIDDAIDAAIAEQAAQGPAEVVAGADPLDRLAEQIAGYLATATVPPPPPTEEGLRLEDVTSPLQFTPMNRAALIKRYGVRAVNQHISALVAKGGR